MLRASFFSRPPLVCARELIGAELVWDGCRGRVVETEAYAAVGDEACHTFRRPSTRDFVARHPAGTAYVYLNYGIHWLFNVLVKGGGGAKDGFVLIRAIEPRLGQPAMRRRRGLVNVGALCSGPGKLTLAFGIDGQAHGFNLCASPARGFFQPVDPPPQIAIDRRVGITRAADFLWRFLHAGSPFVSVRASAFACHPDTSARVGP